MMYQKQKQNQQLKENQKHTLLVKEIIFNILKYNWCLGFSTNRVQIYRILLYISHDLFQKYFPIKDQNGKIIDQKFEIRNQIFARLHLFCLQKKSQISLSMSSIHKQSKKSSLILNICQKQNTINQKYLDFIVSKLSKIQNIQIFFQQINKKIIYINSQYLNITQQYESYKYLENFYESNRFYKIDNIKFLCYEKQKVKREFMLNFILLKMSINFLQKEIENELALDFNFCQNLFQTLDCVTVILLKSFLIEEQFDQKIQNTQNFLNIALKVELQMFQNQSLELFLSESKRFQLQKDEILRVLESLRKKQKKLILILDTKKFQWLDNLNFQNNIKIEIFKMVLLVLNINKIFSKSKIQKFIESRNKRFQTSFQNLPVSVPFRERKMQFQFQKDQRHQIYPYNRSERAHHKIHSYFCQNNRQEKNNQIQGSKESIQADQSLEQISESIKPQRKSTTAHTLKMHQQLHDLPHFNPIQNPNITSKRTTFVLQNEKQGKLKEEIQQLSQISSKKTKILFQSQRQRQINLHQISFLNLPVENDNQLNNPPLFFPDAYHTRNFLANRESEQRPDLEPYQHENSPLQFAYKINSEQSEQRSRREKKFKVIPNFNDINVQFKNRRDQ